MPKDMSSVRSVTDQNLQRVRSQGPATIAFGSRYLVRGGKSECKEELVASLSDPRV